MIASALQILGMAAFVVACTLVAVPAGLAAAGAILFLVGVSLERD